MQQDATKLVGMHPAPTSQTQPTRPPAQAPVLAGGMGMGPRPGQSVPLGLPRGPPLNSSTPFQQQTSVPQRLPASLLPMSGPHATQPVLGMGMRPGAPVSGGLGLLQQQQHMSGGGLANGSGMDDVEEAFQHMIQCI